MAYGEFEIGRKYHCREETTGLALTGFFHIERDTIEAEFFSYAKYFHLDCEDCLVLRTEENHVVSLHDNIPGGTGTNSAQPSLLTYNAIVISNLAVMGRDPWSPTDFVHQVFFRITHTDDTLKHMPTFDRVVQTKIGTDINTEIFSARVANATISASYNYSGKTGYDYPHDVRAALAVEFDAPQTLVQYRRFVQAIVRFFSAVVGIPLNAFDIGISRLDEREQRTAIEARTYYGNHKVFEIQDAHELNRNRVRLWGGCQFAHSRTDNELNALVACLVEWMRREPVWTGPTVLMMESMRMDRVMSADRLLTACKWFEEIPGTRSIPAIKGEDIQTLAKLTGEKAVELGYSDIAGRVAGAIKGLSKETRMQQLERVVAEVRTVFGNDCLDSDIVTYLAKAYGFRGRAAHGHFSPADDREYSEFAKSVHAMECISYLLTIKELPMLDGGRRRVLSNPLVRAYKTTFMYGDKRKDK